MELPAVFDIASTQIIEAGLWIVAMSTCVWAFATLTGLLRVLIIHNGRPNRKALTRFAFSRLGLFLSASFLGATLGFGWSLAGVFEALT